MATAEIQMNRDFWKGCFVGCLVTLVVIRALIISTRCTNSPNEEEQEKNTSNGSRKSRNKIDGWIELAMRSFLKDWLKT